MSLEIGNIFSDSAKASVDHGSFVEETNRQLSGEKAETVHIQKSKK